jgi:putative transposase
MKRKRFTDEQIAMALREAEGGTPVADVCRRIGLGEASYYLWKRKCANLGLTEICELRQTHDGALASELFRREARVLI